MFITSSHRSRTSFENTPFAEVSYGVAYGYVQLENNIQNRFISVGQEGKIWVSGGGGPRAWIEIPTVHLEGRDLFNVTYAQGRFVAVGDRVILYSFDGVAWHRSSTLVDIVLYGVTYNSRHFVAVGQQGTVLYSLDGINWATAMTGLATALSGIYYSGRTFVATSISDENILTDSGGAIIQSAPIAGFDYPPPQNNKRQVSFMTELGKVYRVEATADFLQWSTVEQFVGTGGFRSVTDTSSPEPQRRFYRMRCLSSG